MQPLDFELTEPSKNEVGPEIYEDHSSLVYGCFFNIICPIKRLSKKLL